MFNLPVYFLKSELDAPDTGGQGVLVQVFLCRQLLIGHPFQIQPFQQIQIFLGDQTFQFQVGPRRRLEGLVGQRGLGPGAGGRPTAGRRGSCFGPRCLPCCTASRRDWGWRTGPPIWTRQWQTPPGPPPPPAQDRMSGRSWSEGFGRTRPICCNGRRNQGFYLPGNELHFGCGHGGTLLFFLLP